MESMDDLASPSAEPPGSFSRLGVGLRISLCPGGNELLRAGQVPGVRIFQILEAVGEVVALEARPLRRRRFGKSYCSSPGWSGQLSSDASRTAPQWYATKPRAISLSRFTLGLLPSTATLTMGPKEFIDYLQRHKNELLPEFRKIWEAAGFRTSGTWEEVFRGT